jgi:ketosteroid isomerase-like protein
MTSDMPGEQTHAVVWQAIREQENNYMTAYRQRDPRSLVETVYAPHAHMLAPDQGTIVGTDDITQFFQSIIDGGVSDIQLTSMELDVLHGTAIEVGRATLVGEETEIVDIATFLNVWKFDAEFGWQIHRDIYNSCLSSLLSDKERNRQ